MKYILDLGIIAVFVLAVWNGHRRGFIKAVSGLAAFVAAALVALLLSGPVAGWLFDGVRAPPIKVTIAEQIDATGSSIAGGLDETIGKLPGFVRNALANQGITSGSELLDRTSIGAEDSSSAIAEHVTTQVIRPVAVSLLKMIAFILLFILAYIAARLLLRVINRVFKLPVLRKMNKTLGGLAGALNGALWVLVIVTVLQVMAASSSPDAIINQTVLNDTTVVHWLAGINPVGKALQNLLGVASR